MDKHKCNSLDGNCLCKECEHRFECFTQERVFSDAAAQSLFEGYLALGFGREEAINSTMSDIRSRISATDRGSGWWTSPNTWVGRPWQSDTWTGTYVDSDTYSTNSSTTSWVSNSSLTLAYEFEKES